MAKWYHLTDEEATRLNPPNDADRRPGWLPVGYIPRPATRSGWFAYHVIHGLWMHYPLHKVLGYALANTRPGEIDYSVFELPVIKLPGGEVVEADRVEWTVDGPLFIWRVPLEIKNDPDAPSDYVAISGAEVAKHG